MMKAIALFLILLCSYLAGDNYIKGNYPMMGLMIGCIIVNIWTITRQD